MTKTTLDSSVTSTRWQYKISTYPLLFILFFTSLFLHDETFAQILPAKTYVRPGKMIVGSGQKMILNYSSTSELALAIGGDGYVRLTLQQGMMKKTLWSYFNVKSRSVEFSSDGHFAVLDFDRNILFRIAGSPTSILTFSEEVPYMQLSNESGVYWAATHSFKNLELSAGQSVQITSSLNNQILGTFAMQTDGNLVLYINGKAVWATKTQNIVKVPNGPSARSGFKLVDVGPLRAVFDTLGNLQVLDRDGKLRWIAKTDMPSGTLNLSTISPYITIKGSPQPGVTEERVVWSPFSIELQCASYTSGSINCLHPMMPLYYQGSYQLLDYINRKDGTNLPSDPGWCAPVASSMIGKTIAYEKANYYSWRRVGTATDTFFDAIDSNFVIWSMKVLSRTGPNGGTYVHDTYNAFVSLQMQPAYSQKVVLTDSTENIVQNKVYRLGQEMFSGTGSLGGTTVFGYQPSTFVPTPEALYFQYMPIGYISTCTHGLAVNGREGNYLKIYDPWGSIYDVDSTGYKLTFAKMREGFSAEIQSNCNGVSAIQRAMVFTGHAPIKLPPTPLVEL